LGGGPYTNIEVIQVNSYSRNKIEITVPKELNVHPTEKYLSVDHILSQENHLGVIGIGRKDSDAGFGNSFYSSLRKNFEMMEDFFEIYVDSTNPWLLLSRKTEDKMTKYDFVNKKDLSYDRHLVKFQLKSDSEYRIDFKSIKILSVEREHLETNKN
jgi:sRNA-binding carbon storage regulator CsrA